MNDFQYITHDYHSNCFIEALRAKFNDWHNTKIYFCKPRITENGHFQMCHFMWSGIDYDYDFSDTRDMPLPWYKCFLFKGKIRRFEKGTASRYSAYRNRYKNKRRANE